MLGRIDQLKEDYMKKSLVKNSLYNILYKIISVLYPLVAVTYVSHILMSEKMGMVNYAQNIVSYFVIIAALGIPTYGIREIAVRSDDLYERSNLFWELLIINTISTTFASIGYIILINAVEKFQDQMLLYMVAGLQLLFNYLNVDWFYQGLEEYKYISIRSIFVKLVALLLLPILIRTSDDYIWYAFIYCFAIAGNNIFNIVRIRKYIGRPNRKLQLLKHLKPISILLMVSVAVEIYAMIDTTMLGIFCDDSTVGCYSNAMKLVRMVTTTSAAIGAVLFPRLSSVYNNSEYSEFNKLVNAGIKIMLMISIPACIGMILLRNDIILLFFGETFLAADPILLVLSVMIPIVVCNTLMGGQVLVTTGQETKYMISVVSASIVNVVLNSALIPRFGAPSAAVASLISESLVLFLYICFSRKQVRLRFSFKYIYSMLVPLAIYIVIHFFFLKPLKLNALWNIVINVIVCCALYFGGGFMLKNEAMIFAFSKGKSLLQRR